MTRHDDPSPSSGHRSLSTPWPRKRAGVVYEVSWRDLFSWLALFRAFSLAMTGSALLTALAGLALSSLGWRLSESLFLHPSERQASESLAGPAAFRPWPGREPQWLLEPWRESRPPSRLEGVLPRLSATLGRAMEQFLTVAVAYAHPFFEAARPGQSWAARGYWLFGGFWTLLVWAVCGGLLARLAVVRIGAEERIGLRQAARQVGRKLGVYVAAPLFPLIGVVIAAAPVALLGLLMRSEIGALISAAVWPLALIAGYVMAILLLGLAVGWPLLWPAVAAESADAFDAVSRAYDYSLHRPVHYVFYVALSLVIGAAGLIFVTLFAEGVLATAQWAAQAGLGGAGGFEGRRFVRGGEGESAALASGLFTFWTSLVRAIASAFRFSFFWCAAAGIYLALRLDVDRKEMDEIAGVDTAPPLGLPRLARDAAGASESSREPVA